MAKNSVDIKKIMTEIKKKAHGADYNDDLLGFDTVSDELKEKQRIAVMEDQLRAFTETETSGAEPETITHKVNDLLDELIRQSARLVGKPVALMNKDDKIKAIRFLNDSGAFLITKSGLRVCYFFGISKFTLYSYLDEAKGEKE